MQGEEVYMEVTKITSILISLNHKLNSRPLTLLIFTYLCY